MSWITSTMTTTMTTPFAPTGLCRITVDEYERIIRAGALNDPDRVELKPGQAVLVVIDGQPLGHAAVDAILPSPPAEGNGA
jgi:hypothetical protein